MGYTKTVWENDPSTASPINADNLNNLETQYDEAVADLTAHESDDDAHGGGDFSDRTLIIETRTDDPVDPQEGQVWLRTDL